MPPFYPTSLAQFLTYQDQPGDPNHIITHPDGTQVDLTIDAAIITRQIQEEVVSIEKILGTKPFQIPAMRGMPAGIKGPPAVPMFGWLANSIHWLYYNLASGHADPLNYYNVPPAPPPTHNHEHHRSLALTADDHPQYMRVDGTRSFTKPVTAPAGIPYGGLLINLSQVTNLGITAAQMEFIVDVVLSQALNDPSVTLKPMSGPDSTRHRMTGGYYYGPTDVNGNIFVNLTAAHFTTVESFVFMKMPYPGQSAYYYTYRYEEDQLVLLSLGPNGAWIQFVEDNVIDRRAVIAMTWIALGI